MQVIFKTNNIPSLGGTTPQVSGVKLMGTTGTSDWTIADVPDEQLSAIQEFDAQPMADGFVDAYKGPSLEGAYNSPVFEVDSFGSKVMLERNVGQSLAGVEGAAPGATLTHPDEKDTTSKKNFTSEDIAPFKVAEAFLKKFDTKTVLRNKIRGNIVDIEDDIADTKVASQLALYYFAHEWQTRTQAQKDANPAKVNMEALATKLLSDDVKMRADLSNGISSINEIVEKEEIINKFVASNYSYNAGRGV